MDNLWNTERTNNLTSQTTNNYQSLLQQAQQFSQLAIQHIHSIRQHVGGSFTDNTPEMQCLHELTLAYDKLSSIQWDKARLAYESHINSNYLNVDQDINQRLEEEDVDDMLRDTMEKRSLNSKTPGKKRDMMATNDNAAANNRIGGLNPHDWITNAFQDAPFSEPQMVGLPPGFGDEEEEALSEEEQSWNNESVCSTNSSGATTKCTSTPSEISSLGTQEYGDERDEESSFAESSIESSEPSISNLDEFDYIYKGGYAIKAINGQEIKGVVPKTVKRVFIDSSTVEECAFQGCNELESVTVSMDVEEICQNAFRKCSKLKEVKFPSRRRWRVRESCGSVGEEKKTEEGGRISSASRMGGTATSQLRTIGEWAFFNCSSLESINLPYGLETIGTRAFQRCSVLNLEELPSSLVFVGDNAFSGCSRETRAVLEQWETNRV